MPFYGIFKKQKPAQNEQVFALMHALDVLNIMEYLKVNRFSDVS